MLYRILQSVVLLGLETLFSDNMISGKKRPGLETNINFLLLFMIFWSKSFADFWIIYFLKNISTRSSKETEHGLDFFLDSLIPVHVFFFPLNEILMEMYHHQDTKYGVKRKQPETSRHSVLYHRLKHTDNMEKIKKKNIFLCQSKFVILQGGCCLSRSYLVSFSWCLMVPSCPSYTVC